MFIPSNRAVFSLKIPAVQHDLRVLKFRAEESINQPYSVTLEVVSESADLDLESFLHRSAFLAFDTEGHGIHGKIDQFAQGDSGTRFTHYHLTLVPQIYTLEHRINQRIFQQQTVRQIITTVLEEHGILEDRCQFKLSPTVYEPREYCTQYDESDLHFIQRLCEEEGWHYHFEHSEEDHILVFGDGQTAFKKLEAPTPYKYGAGMVADEPAIHRFQVGVRTTVSRVTRRDYDFKQPHFGLEASTLGDDPDSGKKHPHLEDYEYPGRFSDENTGKRRVARALERRQIEGRQAQGASVQPSLHSGHYLELTGHPRAEWNDLWLLTEVVHEGRQPQVLEESLGGGGSPPKDDFTQGYRNTFSATPALVFYRPQIEHARPSLLGSQTARVVQGGEQIHLRSGADLILDAGAQLTLKTGDHHLVINGDGIFCSTLPLVGGSASSGQALMSVLPQRPGETVKELTERMLALTPLVPVEPVTPPVEKAVCEQCLRKRQQEFTSVLAR